MKPIKLKNLIAEDLTTPDLRGLEEASKKYAEELIQKGLVKVSHNHFSSADGHAEDYTEDLVNVLRNEVLKWMRMVNSRGGR
jgi:hypothetical protein